MEIIRENGKTVVFTNFEETLKIMDFIRAKETLEKAHVPGPYKAIQAP